MAPTKSQKLEDQAATAALYVTKGHSQKKDEKSQDNYPLDKDGKLSSASAATSLKHAQPMDLPSFPTTGMPNPESSAGAAASLANAQHKDFEYWKPGDASKAANLAAMNAKDYKAPPLWQPELSAAGSKAALLANEEGGNVKIWRPEETDAGHSAAEQAMRKQGLSPAAYGGVGEAQHNRALQAATDSMAGKKGRTVPKTSSSGQYPDSANAAANALNAATAANRTPSRATPPAARTGPTMDAGKIHNAAVTNLSREMYTSHPPVAPETEELKRQATLKAAAVSMAKQMYSVQQKAVEQAAADEKIADSRYAARHMHGRRPASSTSSETTDAVPQYLNLQEAAQKLAAERLAKLHDEHRAYREYYGQNKEPQRKLSIRNRGRARSGSDSSDDDEKSRKIRSQMSLFSSKVAEVDTKKRTSDREALMAAAQRNVRASMAGIDEKVYAETGKVSPAMMEEWEAKARAKAKAESDARMVNHGRVDIGGGKFLDQSEIDAIAAAKVQPTLDDITLKAEKQRERDEELRQQQLERERLEAEAKADQRERDARAKEEWRKFKEQEKAEARAKKEEAKAAKRRPRAATNESIVEAEPPVLEPIPTTEPIAAAAPQLLEEETPLTPAQTKAALPEDDYEEATVPGSPGAFDAKIVAQRVLSASEQSAVSDIEQIPATKYEDASPPATPGDLDAAAIAKRVLAAPVENDDASVAPSLHPENIEPLEVTTEGAPPTEAPITTEPKGTTTEEDSKPAVPAIVGPEPVTKRTAPAITGSTSQVNILQGPTTSITGGKPSTPSKTLSKEKSDTSKEPGKVTSWLKSKLRRNSKPTKPAISDPIPIVEEEKPLKGLTPAPVAPNSTSASDPAGPAPGAMAGAGTIPAAATTAPMSGGPTTSNPPNVSQQGDGPEVDPLYDITPPTTGAQQAAPLASAKNTPGSHDRSPSVSTLSTLSTTSSMRRGRSTIPRTHPAGSMEALKASLSSHPTGSDPTAVAALASNEREAFAEAQPPPLTSNVGGNDEAVEQPRESEDQQFEEARDRVDEDGMGTGTGTGLEPPPKNVFANAGEGVGVGVVKSKGSPARDSRFSENI